MLTKYMKNLSIIIDIIRDLIIPLMPYKEDKYGFVFLVHPRNLSDVYRKMPFFKYLPKSIVEIITLNLWPVRVSEVTGLISNETHLPVKGFIISIPLTAKQIIEHKTRAVSKTRAAIKLGKALGAHIFGLGGLVSSATKGGLDLIDIPNISITTGHAYTGLNVTRNVIELAKRKDLPINEVTIAIVGAAGSIGSISAQILARYGFRTFILVDLERKHNLIHELLPILHELNENLNVQITHKINAICDADFVIAATNAPEALIHASDLKSGAIVIDDAQPSDVADDVLDREDVLAIEAGVVHTPGIQSNFNMGLKSREDNFCCMAELLILAHQEHRTHYVINRATLQHVDEIAILGDQLGFRLADFQNRRELISKDKLNSLGLL